MINAFFIIFRIFVHIYHFKLNLTVWKKPLFTWD